MAKKILGMPMTLFVVGLLLVGISGAALVSYLSNAVTAGVEVNSPLELKLKDGSSWVDNINLGTLHGGDTATMVLKERNKGDAPINSNLTITIREAGHNNDCDEIDVLRFKEVSAVGWNDVTSACDDSGNNLVFKVSTVVPANQNQNYNVEVTFDQKAYGLYNATVQHK